ncbi:MAG: hypothetical protein OXM58_04670 [Rhodospirillaceae bacterium]|nr:hypothetical protein [Rhodospirillaceae bacterium]MDE0618371.1 hypothetical protein [Rhodospirillaceae bacterium]
MTVIETGKEKPATPKAEEGESETPKFMSTKSKTLSDHLHATTLGKYPWNSDKKTS